MYQNNQYNQGGDYYRPIQSTLNQQPKLDFNLMDDPYQNNRINNAFGGPQMNQYNQQNQFANQANNYNQRGTPGYGQDTWGATNQMGISGGIQNQFGNPGYQGNTQNQNYNNYNNMNNIGQQPYNQNLNQQPMPGYSNFNQPFQNQSPQNYGIGMGGLPNQGIQFDQQYDTLMRRISNFILSSGHRNFDSFFRPFDCYKSRIIEDWEFLIIFPVLTSLEEVNIIINRLSYGIQGKLEYSVLVSELQTKYNNGIILQEQKQVSIYMARLSELNTDITMTRLEMIARVILESDRTGTYRGAFENAFALKREINQDELRQIILRSGQQVNEIELKALMRYLFIENLYQISKIQFCQGFKCIISEEKALFSGRGGQLNRGKASLTPQQTNFLKQIRAGILKFNIDWQKLLTKSGVQLEDTHINAEQLQEIGRNSRSLIHLEANQLNDLIIKLEDTNRQNHILISEFQNQLYQYDGDLGVSFEIGPIKPQNKWLFLKQFAQNQHKNIDELFDSIQIDGLQNVVDKMEFVTLLNQQLGKPLNEIEELLVGYAVGPGKINLSLIQSDLMDGEETDMTEEQAKQVLEGIFNEMKKLMAKYETNIVSILLDSDQDDGFIDKNELKQAFHQIGLQKITNEQINACFRILDELNTGQLDPTQIIDSFFKYANQKKVTNPLDKNFPVYEKVRKYMTDKRYLSVSSVFQQENNNQSRDEEIIVSKSEFLSILKTVVKVEELQRGYFEQSFMMEFNIIGSDKLDFQKFADSIGYDQFQKKSHGMQKQTGFGDTQAFGKGILKFESRRQFYRTFLRSITNKDQDGTIIFKKKNELEFDFREKDTNLQQLIPKFSFENVIKRYCPEFINDVDLIDIVARDFVQYPNEHPVRVNYFNFMNKINDEFYKLKFLNELYKKLYDTLLFRGKTDLYSLFQKFDIASTRKFDKEQLKQFLSSRGISDPTKVNYLQEEYDPEKSGFVKYTDIEKDYRDLTRDLAFSNKSQAVDLNKVLQVIKKYLDITGKTLRQVFNKTSVKDKDGISQFQFTKIMNEINERTGREIHESHIHKFILEITSQDIKQISFTELKKQFNTYFNLRDEDDQLFIPRQIEELQQLIAQIALDKKTIGFELESHFQYPKSFQSDFERDLDKEPLFCRKILTKDIFDALTMKFTEQNYINTQKFLIEVKDKMFKLEQKQQIFQDIKKQLQLKNLTMREMFYRANSQIKQFELKELSPEEFQSVFLFIEYRISLDRTKKILENLLQADDNGKFNYEEFIQEFEDSQNKQTNKFQGTKNFQNVTEILKRIATCIEQRNLLNLGALLADQDYEQQNAIDKENFYRVLDSLQLGLGQGDILELMRTFRKKGTKDQVDISKFRDELNFQIINPDLKIHLRSVLNQVVQERIVENADLSPRSSKKKSQLEQEAFTKYMPLIQDILCGLFIKGSEIAEWSIKFSAVVKGSLNIREFTAAIEALDVQPDDVQIIKQYYEHLICRQEVYLGFKSQLILIEQFQSIIHKDCALSKDKMLESILYDICKHLTLQMTPIKDNLRLFDPSFSGLVFKQDFINTLLDNYLKLGAVLTKNKKTLLAYKYCPIQAIQFRYEDFLMDLEKIQQQNPQAIRLCWTQQDTNEQMRKQAEMDLKELDQADKDSKIQPTSPDPVAQSKKNTVCTQRTLSLGHSLKVAVASFYFDDIMIESFRKGVAVEVYFKKYSKYFNGMFLLDKDAFSEAVSSLNVKWAEPIKLSEMFDAIDVAVHGSYSRKLRIEDIGEAVFHNAVQNIQFYQAKVIEIIFKGLKDSGMLPKLRDLFNFFNTKRDNTCPIKDLKNMLLDKLGLIKNISESQIDLLMQRYASYDPLRVDFSIFIRDMEYCNLGINASLIWAIQLAEDIVKGVLILGLNNVEQLFQKFMKTQGVIIYDEFNRAMDDIQLSIYHDDQDFRDFFNHIEFNENRATLQHNDYSKVGITQLCNTIKRLVQKTDEQLSHQIMEKIFAEYKKQNQTITVFTIFSGIDLENTGMVSFADFKYGIEEKLRIKTIKPMDLQFLAKKFAPKHLRSNQSEMIDYRRFFDYFERLERYGLKAGKDILKDKQEPKANINQVSELPPEVKKIYSDMSMYINKQKLMDALCQELAMADQFKTGMLNDATIHQCLKKFKIMVNKKQLNYIIFPLAFDNQGNYNYLMMIDMLFGKQQALLIQQKFKLQGYSNAQQRQDKPDPKQQVFKNLVMSIRFKDSVELRFQSIQNIAHSISKGSYLLREQEFYSLFKRAGITLMQADQEFLIQNFRQYRNQNNNAIDFKFFLQTYDIHDAPSLLLMEIQREVQVKNVDFDKAIEKLGDFITFEQFREFLEANQLQTQQFIIPEHKSLFDIIADRKETMEKGAFKKAVKGEYDSQEQEQLPYIVNEFTYFICNNNVDIFKFVNPAAKKLTLQNFQSLIQQMKYIPSNNKEMPQLLSYFEFDDDNKYISVDKIVFQIKKIIPNYGAAAQQNNQKQQQQQPNMQQQLQKENQAPNQVNQISKQLSQFNKKIKAILSKLNEGIRRKKISTSLLLQQMDMNKNGQVEKSEFVVFFSKDLIIKGLTQQDLELLYDALDTNKDGILSISELCLCIQGMQESKEQRLKSFDLDLQKEMVREINELFRFFDKNNDGKISVDELVVAFRSINQNIGIEEAKEIMKISDKDKNNNIDRQEFVDMMLPKLKEELLSYEQNLDDLRRLFKESDSDHSNYLSKMELKTALMKLNIELTDVQLEDLMKELDLDGNQNIDIDEFVAFLSIADQIKFKNPQTKTNIIRIRHAKKLHAIDFYNCFKNLPQCFLPSFTTDMFEKRNMYTPSYYLYPDFDSRTMTYKDLLKLEYITEVDSIKRYIAMHQPHISCEIQIEEFNNVPLPRKEEFDWTKITHREVRAVLYDFRSGEFLSNSFLIQAQWKPEYEGKWLFNTNDNLNQAKNFILRTDYLKTPQSLVEVHLLIELVYYTVNQDQIQQVTCAWGIVPAQQLDKAAKIKVQLRGGSPITEIKMNQSELHQPKSFNFLKKIVANVEEANLVLNVRPFSKFSEQSQYYVSMLPSNCLISKRLISFGAAFRLYCQRKLSKSQQLMIAPQGNFVIAQFKKIFDCPDINMILGDCWELDVNQKLNNQVNLNMIVQKMEDFMIKLYSIIYSTEFAFDHVNPTRSSSIDSELFKTRELLIKNALIPGRYKPFIEQPKPKKGKEAEKPIPAAPVFANDDYKPFNISEMEISISGLDDFETKQDELLKMYQQMGLIY